MSAFLDLVELLTPKALLIENVVGFTRGACAATPAIERRLREINSRRRTTYVLHSRAMNAVDFGVPQRRERSILVAIDGGSAFKWPEKTHREMPVRAWDALAGVTPRELPATRGKWASLISSIPEGSNYLWHTARGGGLPLFGDRTRFWSFLLKLAKDEPSWTLPAQPGPATGPFHWDNRPLAVEEMLRLQTFPSDWQVSGAYREQVRQIGNATPPLFSEIIGRSLGEQVFGLDYEAQPRFAIQRRNTIPEAAATAPVPAHYATLAGEHPAHPGPGRGPHPLRAL